MKVDVMNIHDCTKPVIPYKEITKQVERRTWYGRKVTDRETTREYKHRAVRWTCEICGSRWEWNNMFDGSGFWRCIERVEIWKKANL